MAITCHAVLCQILNRGGAGGQTQPVPKSVPVGAETETPEAAGSQVATTLTATSAESEYWIVTVDGGDVWVKFGVDAEASAGNDWLMLDGETREFSVTTVGERASFIDASLS